MSYLDWVVVLLLVPCLIFKSTKVPAFVLLMVFPVYAWAKEIQVFIDVYHSPELSKHIIKYMIFGFIDFSVGLVIILYHKKYNSNKGDIYIALLALTAVAFHFTRWFLREKGVNLEFYSEACASIVFLQITALYWRILKNGILFKDFLSDTFFRAYDACFGKQNIKLQKKQTRKGEISL